jgi:hypothetical protein
MVANLMGRILHSPFASFCANNGTDLYALGMSYIEYHLNGGTPPTCNPAAGVVGNSNSLIAAPATMRDLRDIADGTSPEPPSPMTPMLC